MIKKEKKNTNNKKQSDLSNKKNVLVQSKPEYKDAEIRNDIEENGEKRNIEFLNLKRIIEPGTPTTKSVFQVIEKFSKSGIKCVINIDPIIPLLTDSRTDITNILDTASDIGIKYISGAILRIRYDIWERIKHILQILNKDYLIPMYEKIFKFKDPITFKNNLVAEKIYSDSLMDFLRNEVHKRKMNFGFPYLNSKKIISTKINNDMVTLLDFIK